MGTKYQMCIRDRNNCYGIAQVQRTDISDHRDPYAGFLIIDQNVLREDVYKRQPLQ